MNTKIESYIVDVSFKSTPTRACTRQQFFVDNRTSLNYGYVRGSDEIIQCDTIGDEYREYIKFENHTLDGSVITYVVWSPEFERLVGTPLRVIKDTQEENINLISKLSQCHGTLESTQTKLIDANKEVNVLHNQIENLKEKNITLKTCVLMGVITIVTLISKIISINL